MEKNHVHDVKCVWEQPCYLCRVRQALASPLPCQTDGERSLAGDVLVPVCCCSVCALQRDVLQSCMNTLTCLGCNATASIEIKQGCMDEALCLLAQRLHSVPCHVGTAMPRSLACNVSWGTFIPAGPRANVNRISQRKQSKRDNVAKSECLVSHCFRKTEKGRLLQAFSPRGLIPSKNKRSYHQNYSKCQLL